MNVGLRAWTGIYEGCRSTGGRMLQPGAAAVGENVIETRNWVQKRVGWSSPHYFLFGPRVRLGETEACI